jgi:7-alpha-hydroxysteroid dehydrogenase
VTAHRWFDLTGKVALITGGSAGIGRGIAHAFAEAGASVAIAARRPELIEKTTQELRDLGAPALGVSTDVRSVREVEELTSRVIESFGRIDILVNNAGGSYGDEFRRAPLLDLTAEDFDGCFAENVLSHFLVSKAVVPSMLLQGRGSIVNISSWIGRESAPAAADMGFYPVSKAAFNKLNTVMATEWAPTVRVNAISPGFIATERVSAIMRSVSLDQLVSGIALGRVGHPDDVAAAAVFLASDAASWITGISIDVTGGVAAPHTAPEASRREALETV